MTSAWVSVDAAASRVQRSQATIRRWIRDKHLRPLAGRLRVDEVLRVDKQMRDSAAAPRRTKRITLTVGSVHVGDVWVNTSTGKVVRGSIEVSNIVDRVDVVGLR